MTIVPICEDWVGRLINGRLPLLQWLGGSKDCGVFLTERPGKREERLVVKLMPAEAADAGNRARGWAVVPELEHPHLLRLYEWGRCEVDGADFAYVVTEFAPEVLEEILQERVLAGEETRAVLEPLLNALEYLHGRGLVHGHVKPSNIMADGETLKLTADHLLRMGESVSGESVSGGYARGDYDAPEMGRAVAAPTADVWSLGLTLVEMLTRKRPSPGANGELTVPEGIPEPFAGIARECLRMDAAQRCGVAEIRARLRPEPVVATTAPAKTLPAQMGTAREAAAVHGEVAGAPDSSQGSRTWIGVVGVLALVVLVAWFFWPAAKPTRLTGNPPVSHRSVSHHSGLPVPTASPSSSRAGRVTTGAVPVKGAVAERFPPEAVRSALATIHGTVHVDVRVTAGTDGKVEHAVFADHGPSRYFANVSRAAAMHWVFRPAEVNGRAVRSVWLLRFAYTRNGDGVTATEVSP